MNELETIDAITQAIEANAAANDYDGATLGKVLDHLAWMHDQADEREVFTLEEVLRARQACEVIIRKNRKGKILDHDLDGYIVMTDDEGLAFVQINLTTKPLGDSRVTNAERIAFEHAFGKYAAKHRRKVPECKVRLDVIDFQVFDANKAFTRYHIDATNEE